MTEDDISHENNLAGPEKLTGAQLEAERRRQRAARQLRMNLQRRKAQVRARREGAPDERAEGLPAAGNAEISRQTHDE